MTKLTDFLSPETIQHGVFLSSKKRALELVGKLAAQALNQHSDESSSKENGSKESGSICPVECFSQLFKREKLGSTALNHGIALPHAKLPPSDFPFTQPIAVFLQLETPIDYDAQDQKEVDLIYAILFPAAYCETHRASLSEIAQKLADKNLLKHLRNAQSADEIWQILCYADKAMEANNAANEAAKTPADNPKL